MLFTFFSLGCLIELKFCEVSQNSFSNRCWKFQLFILKNKKVLFLKKKCFFLLLSISKQKSFVYWPNFQWRFWGWYCKTCEICKGPSINDVSLKGEEGRLPSKPMKGYENSCYCFEQSRHSFWLPKNTTKASKNTF